MQVWGDRPQTIPPDYSGLADPWNVGGLLDIDLCWVTEGFDILVGTSGKPALTERRILLAFEHEDATYADRSGTNLNEILDEVRKIGSVRTNIKVLSFFTSQSEAREGRNIPPIQQEIARFPEAPSLTDTWMILQLSRYEAPRTEFRQIIVDGVPHLSVRGVLLRGDAADPHLLAEEVVRLPGNL
jgi:hypothetical protein